MACKTMSWRLAGLLGELCDVAELDEGLRDSDEHANKNGVMQALRNKRLFMGRILLHKKKTAPIGAVCGGLGEP